MQKITAVIPAAGVGKRMLAKVPKQYLTIAGKPILQHTLEAFLSFEQIAEVIVVTSQEDEYYSTIPADIREKVHRVDGGIERYHSVLAGIDYAHKILGSDWVMVHDAARPGVTEEIIQRLIDACSHSELDELSGAVAALPCVDTIKQSVTDNGVVSINATLNRETIWMAQTPQFFPTQHLISAITKALDKNIAITDEASAVEFAGGQVLLVEGSAENLKVTRPEDKALIEFYLTQKQ